MYLPKTYENFSVKFSEIMKAYQQLGKTCREAGPLEYKCQDLIKLGIAGGRLIPISYGEEDPADPGQTETAWALNRRCQFGQAVKEQ